MLGRAACWLLQVVVAEGAPRYDGHTMARKLADAGIQTTAIADSTVFAMMARANKVRGAVSLRLTLSHAVLWGVLGFRRDHFAVTPVLPRRASTPVPG